MAKAKPGKTSKPESKAVPEVTENVTITQPNLKTATFRIIGTAPYVQNKFSEKAKAEIRATQEAGSTGKKGKKREAKDFDKVYEQAKHVSREGWLGVPAPAFRSAMIDACRLVGFKMTVAKISVFAEADGFDKEDGTPLVKIVKGKPHPVLGYVRNESGVVDLRNRPMWDHWECDLRITYDADQFTLTDVGNLLLRAGTQVGVGEGRPFSKKSHGMGWGTFRIEQAA